MKNKLIELSRLARETVGASCSLVIMKNGKFKIEFGQIGLKSDHAQREDPETCIDEAIERILNKRELLLPNTPRDGMAPEVQYTMKKQI